MNAYRVHFEVDELSAREGDNDLPTVDRALHDLLLAWRLPLVDPLVGPDVANAVRIDLDEGIVSERGAGEGRGSAQETGVCDLFYCLADGEDECGVDEGDDDVGIKLVWNRRQT